MLGFIKKIWWLVKENWILYILITIIGILHVLSLLIPATIIGYFASHLANETLTETYLFSRVLIPFALVALLIYLLITTRNILQNRLKVRLYKTLQTKYVQRILEQDAAFFEVYQSGDLLTRAIGDVRSVNFSAGNRLINIFLDLATLVILFFAMFFINSTLTLFATIPLSFIFFINFFLKKKIKRNWKKVREINADMSNVILESITNVRTVRAFSKEEDTYRKNLEHSNKTYNIEKKMLKLNVSVLPMFQSITSISLIMTYFFAARMIILDNTLQVNELVTFLLFLGMFATPLTRIGNMLNNFYQSFISLDRLNEIYESTNTVFDKIDAKVLKKVEKIEFKNFSFKYPGDEYDTIIDINLTIETGKNLGIVGKTGSGKSTLAKQILRYYPVEDKTLFINGKEISYFNKESVRKKISYVPQEHILFSRSVEQNVRLGIDDVNDKQVSIAIKNADFEKDIPNMPNGLKTVVGEYGVTLSGGQKQRLGIARAFARNEEILILDDSLSAVDGKTEANIIKNIKDYRKNKTNIIIAHRLSAVMHAEHIIVLDKGRIIEEGTHAQLLSKKGWYYETHKAQQMTSRGDDNE